MNKAISLIETAIVLLIIAALYGGIKFGYSILHKSYLISTAATIDSCVLAYDNFVSDYNKLPGDKNSDGKIDGPVFASNSEAAEVFPELKRVEMIDKRQNLNNGFVSTKSGFLISIAYFKDHHYLILAEKDNGGEPAVSISSTDIRKIISSINANLKIFVFDGKEILAVEKIQEGQNYALLIKLN